MFEAPASAPRALALAAAPTFATMALATFSHPAVAVCGDMGASRVGGMTAMYLLMSLFHLAAWLRA